MVKKSSASWWTTMPGILTGGAALLTALVGVYAAITTAKIEPPRMPGAIVTWAATEPKKLVSIRLDDGILQPAPAGLKRFENVSPGKHLLQFFSEGYVNVRIGPFEVKSGGETSIPFPSLQPISSVPSTAQAGTETQIGALRGLAPNSLFRLVVSGKNQPLVFFAKVSSGSGSGNELSWDADDLIAGKAMLRLGAGKQYAVRVTVMNTGRSPAQVVALGSVDGISRGASRMVPPLSIYTLVFVLTVVDA